MSGRESPRFIQPAPPALSVGGDSQETIPPSDERESDLFDSLLQRVAAANEPPLPNATPPAAGSVLGGKYQVEAALGRGGMGYVFRARHLGTGRAVALKWMLPRQDAAHSRQRFLREAQAIGRIRHPNVVDIYDVDSTDSATYLVMELLEGETLRARLKRGRLEITEAVDMAVELLGALRAAHRQGIIHRDLKPENVFLAQSEAGEVVVKVLDFGTSTFSEGGQVGTDETLTRTGQFIGTPLYTALERLRENQPFDCRVDVYSMGVILYEALTGRLPFAAQSVSELTFQLATTEPISTRQYRPELPVALDRVVMQALARDPSARPADAESFAHALAAACPGSRRPDIASVPPKPPRESSARPERRARSRALPAAVAAVVVLVAFAVWFLQRDRRHVVDGARAAVSRAPTPPSTHAAAPTAASTEHRNAETPVTSADELRGAPSSQGSSTSPATRSLKGSSDRPAPSEARSTSARSGAASPKARATLTVVVLPYGKVWVDGVEIGASPITVDVAAGAHVVAAGSDAPEQESQVTLASGEPRRVVLSLRK